MICNGTHKTKCIFVYSSMGTLWQNNKHVIRNHIQRWYVVNRHQHFMWCLNNCTQRDIKVKRMIETSKQNILHNRNGYITWHLFRIVTFFFTNDIKILCIDICLMGSLTNPCNRSLVTKSLLFDKPPVLTLNSTWCPGSHRGDLEKHIQGKFHNGLSLQKPNLYTFMYVTTAILYIFGLPYKCITEA